MPICWSNIFGIPDKENIPSPRDWTRIFEAAPERRELGPVTRGVQGEGLPKNLWKNLLGIAESDRTLPVEYKRGFTLQGKPTSVSPDVIYGKDEREIKLPAIRKEPKVPMIYEGDKKPALAKDLLKTNSPKEIVEKADKIEIAKTMPKFLSRVVKGGGYVGLGLEAAHLLGLDKEPEQDDPNWLFQIRSGFKGGRDAISSIGNAVTETAGDVWDSVFSTQEDLQRKKSEQEGIALAQEKENYEKLMQLQQQVFGQGGGIQNNAGGNSVAAGTPIPLGQEPVQEDYSAKFEELRGLFSPRESEIPVERGELSDDATKAMFFEGAEGVIPNLLGSWYGFKARGELADRKLDKEYQDKLLAREEIQRRERETQAEGLSALLKLEMAADADKNESMKPKVHNTAQGIMVEQVNPDGMRTLTPFTGGTFQKERVKAAVGGKVSILGRDTKIENDEPFAKEQMVLARLYETGRLEDVMAPIMESDYWKELPIQVQQQYVGETPDAIAKIIHQQRLATMAAALARKPELAEKAYRAAGLIE